VSGGGQPIRAIILAHGEYPALGTGSIMGAELHPKSVWGGEKKEQKRIYLKMYLPDSMGKQKGGNI
jgi:hypothetical protein